MLPGHYPGSQLLRAHPPPSCHNLTSQRILVIELTCSKPFFLGQVGLLQLLDMSLLPCCRYHPAGIEQTCASLVCLCCLRLQIAGSASRVFRLRGHLCVYLRLRPGDLLITPKMTLSIGFKDFGFPYLCYPSYRVSGFYPDRTASC